MVAATGDNSAMKPTIRSTNPKHMIQLLFVASADFNSSFSRLRMLPSNVVRSVAIVRCAVLEYQLLDSSNGMDGSALWGVVLILLARLDFAKS